MKNIFRTMLLCSISAIIATACDKNGQHEPDAPPMNDSARVAIKFSGCAGADSKVCADENSVSDLNVWCYLNGRLDAFSYNADGNCSVRLFDGADYSIFAIANCGRMAPPFLESDALDAKYEFPAFSDDPFRDALPMSTFTPVSINTSNITGIVPLELTRLVAKYKLTIGTAEGTVSQLAIKSVSIRNSPACVCLFKNNSPNANMVDGDVVLTDSTLSRISLYLAENIQSGQLDERVCSYVEIKGRLKYEDKPRPDAVYILDQDMTFRWYFKEQSSGNFSVRRNTEYSAVFSWSDFGWLADPDHVTVDKILDDSSYCLSFCDKNGTPLSGSEFSGLDSQSVIDIYYRVLPAADSSFVKISTSIPPQSIHLSFIGEPLHIGNGVFRQRIANNTDRELPADIIFWLTNAARGISCNMILRLKGSGNCVGDWEKEDDETVNF